MAVHVYEEGLFHLRGGKRFQGGQMPPPPKETLIVKKYMEGEKDNQDKQYSTHRDKIYYYMLNPGVL